MASCGLGCTYPQLGVVCAQLNQTQRFGDEKLLRARTFAAGGSLHGSCIRLIQAVEGKLLWGKDALEAANRLRHQECNIDMTAAG